MSAAHDHDPVNAISEAEATSRKAEIFAEIREVMQIPLVTSIWRKLDAIDGGLEAAWAATKPIYLSGQPDDILKQLRADINLPIPKTLTTDEVRTAGIEERDIQPISTILAAYNRSNSLNLIALTALARKGSTQQLEPVQRPKVQWPTLPPLLSQAEINQENWSLLERTIPIGVRNPTTALPTLWRHIIHWPGFIELMLEHYQSLHQSGELFDMVKRVTAFVEQLAPGMSHFRDTSADVSEAAIQMIEAYVGEPQSVCRMSSVGSSVEKWLRASCQT
ncbi:MAG: hypothetical protein P8L44_15545 [Opitutales bacterium]|nr:hypothetical protein [Opitutales bacterium]